MMQQACYRRPFLWGLVFLLILVTLPTESRAEEPYGPVARFVAASDATIKLAYISKYIGQHGVDYFNNDPAFVPVISVSLGDTGIYSGVRTVYSLADGCRNTFGALCADWDEFDYFFAYGRNVGSGRLGAILDTKLYYYGFPKVFEKDFWELSFSSTHKNLLPMIGGSRPALYWGCHYRWPVPAKGVNRRKATLGVSYDLQVAKQMFAMTLDAVWSNGADLGRNEEGLSRIRVGLASSVPLGNINLTASIHYQQAMAKSNPDNWLESEGWFTISAFWKS